MYFWLTQRVSRPAALALTGAWWCALAVAALYCSLGPNEGFSYLSL